MPIEDGLPDIPLEGGTVNINITTSQHKTVPSSSAESPQHQYTSTIDDSKLVTATSSMSSTPSSITTSSPVYSPISSPRSHSPSSSSMDGISALHKRSRGSISSHSGSGSDTDDDERATKRHQSDSDIDSIASDETRTHESIVTIKYGEHAIRVLTIEDGTRVVVAKDFLLLTGISKENCARTTKNLIEGKDKRMMHVPSSYCMNKGQQAVVLTCSGLSQLLVTSRRLKQSAALQAWIKQTLMPALQGHATTATSTNHTTEHVLMQSQSQAHNKINTNSKNGRTIVKAKRSVGKSPSASPVVKAAPAPLALSPTTSSFSPFIRSPSSSSSSASSSPIRPTFSRLSSSDSESTMSDASTSSSTPSSPSSSSSSLSSSGMQELSAAADMMLIAPNNPMPNNPMPMPLAKPLPLHFPMSIPLMPTFSRIHPTFPYRTPLMPAPTMAAIGMGIRPTFTAGKIWAAGA